MKRGVIDKAPPRCVSSGSTLLDLALGGNLSGGWGTGRIINLVGDRSSGKTLLAIDACANFAMLFGPEQVRYAESEDAFDEAYGRVIGMPDGIGRTEPGAVRTIEDFEKDLSTFLKQHQTGVPCLYVIDSLDALSDNSEMKREFGSDTYGVAKAKLMSELFRRINSEIAHSNCTLMVVSQTRDKIGVVFGLKKTRSGGQALEFYASQIVWLRETGKIKRTVFGADRIVGIDIVANIRKNKMALPFREAPIVILFNYGTDDHIGMAEWLKSNKANPKLLPGIDINALPILISKARQKQDYAYLKALSDDLRQATETHWLKIEQALQPNVHKYR
jgi:recombination protein RecA